ncbi:helix-turn-helix transcriptional regulator [Parapedobacter sp. ISTM3]|nr:helix-turn-helix transcriptional regulator [Parapedobacter sp. ISTM3]
MMRNYSQEWVAMKAGITQGALSKIEKGLTEPSAATLKKIADCLEVDINVFFEKPVSNSVWSTDSLIGRLIARVRYWWWRRSNR